jgi:Transcriptional regulators
MTIGVVRALHEAGRSVPGDMAVVVYDDFPWADVFSPRLTAIAQPSAEIGSLAIHMLLERLADPSLPPRTVRLQPHLVHRDSCGCT